MQISDVIENLNKRIKENKDVVGQLSVELESIRKQFTAADTPSKAPLAAKIMIVKDRIVFHRAVILAYQDLLQEITK